MTSWHDSGSGELRVERRQRAMPDTQHDNGRRCYENATGREGGLEIKPGETITLAPGGFHMMLVTLKHLLETGQTVKATLKFDKAGTVDVDYPVVAIGAPAPGAAAGGGSMKMQDHGGMMQMDKH
jgi:hypothetical protein